MPACCARPRLYQACALPGSSAIARLQPVLRLVELLQRQQRDAFVDRGLRQLGVFLERLGKALRGAIGKLLAHLRHAAIVQPHRLRIEVRLRCACVTIPRKIKHNRAAILIRLSRTILLQRGPRSNSSKPRHHLRTRRLHSSSIQCMRCAFLRMVRHLRRLCLRFSSGSPPRSVGCLYFSCDFISSRNQLARFSRPPSVASPPPAVLDKLARRPILITGAGGSIGSALARRFVALGMPALILLEASESNLFELHNLCALDRNGLYLRSPVRLRDSGQRGRPRSLEHIFDVHDPRLVFHAAAYKHVPLLEEQPLAAIANNIFGTATVT